MVRRMLDWRVAHMNSRYLTAIHLSLIVQTIGKYSSHRPTISENTAFRVSIP